ncbi:Non-specific serine/threonine protein kinase [Bertholletia excelsa]
MLSFPLQLSSLLFLLTSTAVPYTPTDHILLNCGSASNSTSLDGRSWDGDVGSKFSPPNADDMSQALPASKQDTSVDQVPFMTARIFQSYFTYTFPASSGPKFVRLYFYPATYSNFSTSNTFFSVNAGDYTLLRNFSAFLAVSTGPPQQRQATLIKEFVLTVREDQQLKITFVPSPQSYAFVNGIEIVSMPSNLYIRGDADPVSLVGSENFVTITDNKALETLYRLNVGGKDVSGGDDTGMYRFWQQDDPYIFSATLGTVSAGDVTVLYTDQTPNYTAPSVVYITRRTMEKNPTINLQTNLTWNFLVDPGFEYLIRLHFCEIQVDVNEPNQRVFTVFLNNLTADQAVDVIALSGGIRIPVFRDYVVLVPFTDERPEKQVLWLALHPYVGTHPTYADALLNGLEIFKLSQSDGNLAGPNPEPSLVGAPDASDPKFRSKKKSKGPCPAWVVLASVIGGVFVLSLLAFLSFRHRKKVKDSGATPSDVKSSWLPLSYTTRSNKTNASPLPFDLCRRFLLSEIISATSNFSDDNLIGRGGFGNVYKGYIDDRTATVAIKRLNPQSNQGAREFLTEIQMLSKLRHLHLVSLIGYCDDAGEMIILYDFMANGTLRDHLYNTTNPPLSWKQRIQICIGAARGLHYLHTGAKHTIIHRDVKSTNILLDEKWVPKVSDFGLSKKGPDNPTHSHVSTAVKGSFGYVDPEYFRRRQLTEKSDVYSFGVVLLEVLCARPAVVTGLPKEQVSLASWGRRCLRKGTVHRIMDPYLKDHVAPDCLRKFGEIIESCLRDDGIERPAMNDVVWGLEFALQLQEAAEKDINSRTAFGGKEDVMMSPLPPLSQGERDTTTDDDDDGMAFSGSKSSGTSTAESGTSSINYDDRFALKSETVFSQIKNPKGR